MHKLLLRDMERERYIRRFEAVIAYYSDTLYNRSSHRGQLFESELESFIFAVRRLHGSAHKHHLYRRMDSFYQEEMGEFITSTEDLVTEPHRKTAIEQFDYCARTYTLFIEPIIALGTSLKDNDGFDFERACQCFKSLKDAYIEDYLQPYREPGRRQRIASNRIKSFRDDKTIFLELTASIFVSLSIVDDSKIVSQIVKSVFNRLDNLLLPKKNITPNDIFTRLSQLPQPVYQGICNHFLQSGFITETLYYQLVLSIKSEDSDSFSTIVTKNNLYLDLTKYYDLIELACSLNSTLNERQFAPEDYIGLISNYYEQLIPRNETKTSASRAGVSVVCIYNDIKDYLEILSEVYPPIHVFRLKQFLLYERFCRIKFSTTSIISESSQPTSSVAIDITNQSSVDADTSNQTTITNEKEFNCIIPEKDIDPFLEYLVWRGYLKEGDQASFKYDVFGGKKPSDYRDISFKIDSNIAGKTMLGVIIWKLRKENDDPVRLYNEKVYQANSQITSGDKSMRVFVDFGLFFPDLIDSLKMKHSNLEPIRKRLYEQVQELSGSDEYKNCSSILEFIQQHEKKNYWVIPKKKEILGR